MKKLFLRLVSLTFAAMMLMCFAVSAEEMYTQSTVTILEEKIVFHVEFSEALDSEYISIALYNENGRMLDYFMVPALYGKTSADIVTDDIDGAAYAKLFIMADKTGLQPLTDAESVTIREKKKESGYLFLTPDEDGKMIDTWISEYGIDTYVYAYFIETEKQRWIRVNTNAGIFPDISQDVSAYENKLAYYTVDYDENGVSIYTIQMLGNAYDAENNYIGINQNDAHLAALDEEIDFYTETEAGYFYIEDDNLYFKDTISGKNILDFGLEATEDTKVVVFDKESNTIAVWSFNDAVGIIDNLESVQIYVKNNPDSIENEKLVLLYAKMNGGKRILKLKDVSLNENEEIHATYDLFNPYTGAVEENIPGVNALPYVDNKDYESKFSYGDIVSLTDGKVNDTETDERDNTILCGTDKLFWVIGYDEDEMVMEIVNVPEDGSVYGDETVYRIDVSDTPITIMGKQNSGYNVDMIRWGSMQIIPDYKVAGIDGSDRSYLACNKTYFNETTGVMKTVYAKNVKIYLDAVWKNEADRTVTYGNNLNGKANFAIIIANTGEPFKYCNLP